MPAPMCGRFTHAYTWSQLRDHLEAFVSAMSRAMDDDASPRPSYNVAPTADAPALRIDDDGALAPATMRWWLTPHWSKTAEAKYATFNARSEDAPGKPAFRAPFRRRRCVVPVSGFYEWKKLDDGAKQPVYITRADAAPMYLAGLWDRWAPPDGGDALESCAILTTGANDQMRAVHHRMPCVLEPERVGAWLDRAVEDPDVAGRELRPAPDGVLAMWPVDRRVGDARRHNDAGLIEPV